MIDIQDTSREFRELDEKLRAAGLTPEEQARWEQLRADAGGEPVADEPLGVLWEDGPVEQPPDPLPDLAPPLPPPDPSFAAVVVEVTDRVVPEIAPEVIPEIGDEDVEEIVEGMDAPVAIATVSWADEEGPHGEVVSLDALLATPPPASAESLAPPLPPPLPSGAAPFHPLAPEPPLQPGPDPFAPSPSFVSGDHRVVLHTVEGQVLRGSLANADLCDVELPLLQPNGAVARIPAAHVKAIFFMLPAGERPPAAAGTRLRVVFGDGRQVSGLSPDYSAESPGFFVLPLDSRTNTARVWVYRAAARQLTVG